MQTFLPYADFEDSARALDDQRLGKQRVEAMQVLNAMHRATGGWRNHPCTNMWRGFDDALKAYMNACIAEWVRRGFTNTMAIVPVPETYPCPPWLGDERLHASHRANLLRKDSSYYGHHGWTDDPGTPYFWPSASHDPAA